MLKPILESPLAKHVQGFIPSGTPKPGPLCGMLIFITMASCVPTNTFITSVGPLRVVSDEEVVILSQTTSAESVPISGGIAVRELSGRLIPFEARVPALEAIDAYCAEQEPPGVPLFFGWRQATGGETWTAAGCQPLSYTAPRGAYTLW